MRNKIISLSLLSAAAIPYLISCTSGGNSSSSIQYTTLNYSGPLGSGGATGLTGIRQVGGSANVYITGSYVINSYSNGTLYVGPITGGGSYYTYNYPSAPSATTSGTNVYSADNTVNGNVRLTGTYTTVESGGAHAFGFYYEGSVTESPPSGWQTIEYQAPLISVENTYPHSIMGDLIVGNYDSVATKGNAFMYVLSTQTYSTILKPSSAYTTAYGIWHNAAESYTIVGGYSDNVLTRSSAMSESIIQLTRGYIVDYNAATQEYSNWTAFDYNNIPTATYTHFEGITSDGSGGYNLAAGWIANGSLGASFVHVTRNANGSFNPQATWINSSYPNAIAETTTADTVYQNYLLGVYQESGSIAPLNGYVANIPGGYYTN